MLTIFKMVVLMINSILLFKLIGKIYKIPYAETLSLNILTDLNIQE